MNKKTKFVATLAIVAYLLTACGTPKPTTDTGAGGSVVGGDPTPSSAEAVSEGVDELYGGHKVFMMTDYPYGLQVQKSPNNPDVEFVSAMNSRPSAQHAELTQYNGFAIIKNQSDAYQNANYMLEQNDGIALGSYQFFISPNDYGYVSFIKDTIKPPVTESVSSRDVTDTPRNRFKLTDLEVTINSFELIDNDGEEMVKLGYSLKNVSELPIQSINTSIVKLDKDNALVGIDNLYISELDNGRNGLAPGEVYEGSQGLMPDDGKLGDGGCYIILWSGISHLETDKVG